MHNKLSALTLIIASSLSLHAVNISGTINYERVHPLHDGSSTILDTNNITTETAKQIIVSAINSAGTTIASTVTNDNGQYLLSNLPSDTNVKIRAYAKMLKSSGWDVKVVDNTNSNAQYIMEGSLTTTGSNDSVRTLKASASTKSSPPFAILDSVYLAMNKTLAADSSVVFPPLKMNWSINNVESGTYYDGNDNIMIQGDQQGDSDEYDGHIMIHEWGHYFEAKFSRADSIGGTHGSGDHLDIRLAFGEGWGNALSAMVTDDPLYYDTYNNRGWNMNIETASKNTPGWFSEASIQRILYDIYDSNDDGADNLSLGFQPIYDLLTGPQKTTEAFTSLFTFITELKNENTSSSAKIDAIIANEDIATIDDIYGTNRLSNNVETATLPIYNELTINETLTNICTTTTYGVSNKLNNHKYVRFTINENKTYPIKVVQTNGSTSDPDFVLFQTSPFQQIALSEGSKQGVEEISYTLPTGQYILNLYDARNTTKACFNISVGSESSIPTTSSVGIKLPTNPLITLLLFLGLTTLPLLFIRKELKL